MTKQIEEYSVGQLARLSGTSVRTLHHYDELGLLKPAYVGENGYRHYRRAELLRLQEILFYRSVDMTLAEIADVLNGPEPPVDRLLRHRERLAEQARKTADMLNTLDATIAHLQGDRTMAIEDLYKPFTAERQAEHEAWLIETYGGDMAERIAASRIAVETLPEGLEGAMADLRNIEGRLVAAFEAGADPASEALHDTLEDHRGLMARFWGQDCSAEAFEGLAEMYRTHPDFIARYEQLSPTFSEWLPNAMIAHAIRLRGSA